MKKNACCVDVMIIGYLVVQDTFQKNVVVMLMMSNFIK